MHVFHTEKKRHSKLRIVLIIYTSLRPDTVTHTHCVTHTLWNAHFTPLLHAAAIIKPIKGGLLFTWGEGHAGQLGIGKANQSNRPYVAV